MLQKLILKLSCSLSELALFSAVSIFMADVWLNRNIIGYIAWSEIAHCRSLKNSKFNRESLSSITIKLVM